MPSSARTVQYLYLVASPISEPECNTSCMCPIAQGPVAHACPAHWDASWGATAVLVPVNHNGMPMRVGARCRIVA